MSHVGRSYQLEESEIYDKNQFVNENIYEYCNLNSFYAVKGKRLLDLLLVLLGLPFLLPIILVIAILVKLDGGTIIYKQRRVGFGGEEFWFLKFRTMIPNAEFKLRKHLQENPAAAAEWETMQKLEHDPRVTKIGRLIRKTSLDELPQLWNVLVGDMSLVGPRPFLPEQEKLYQGREYVFMKPGITGLWQVLARNKVGFSRRASFDSIYAQNIGFLYDLKILLKTFGVVCRRTGN